MRVTDTAINYGGAVLTGGTWESLLARARSQMPHLGGTHYVLGFVTDVGMFVNPKFAFVLAVRAGQIKPRLGKTVLEEHDLSDLRELSDRVLALARRVHHIPAGDKGWDDRFRKMEPEDLAFKITEPFISRHDLKYLAGLLYECGADLKALAESKEEQHEDDAPVFA